MNPNEPTELQKQLESTQSALKNLQLEALALIQERDALKEKLEAMKANLS